MDVIVNEFLCGPWKMGRALRARTTFKEFHTEKERYDLIYEPTWKYLEDLAREKPKQIVMFFGPVAQFPKQDHECLARHLYIVNQRTNEGAYLGTVFTKKAFSTDQRMLAKKLQEELKPITKKIVRDWCFCIIRADGNTLDPVTLATAAKRYFHAFKRVKGSKIAMLSEATICFLSEEIGAEYDRMILKEAERIKKPDPDDETKRRIFMEEIW